jgi:hypothetical protein
MTTASALEGLERPVPRRVLDAETSPLEGVGQRAVARAQPRPGAAGGEDDAVAHRTGIAAQRSIADLRP